MTASPWWPDTPEAERLAAVCRAAGIAVEVTDADRPCAMVRDARYVVQLTPEFASGEDAVHALAHELAHVLRGDLVRLQSEDLQPIRWNVAADAVINSHLPDDWLTRHNAVRWTALAARYGWAEPSPPAALEVYRRLADDADDGGHDTLATDGTMTDAEHARVVVTARAADPEAVADVMGGRLPGTGPAVRRSGWQTPEPVAVPALRALFHRLDAKAQAARRRHHRDWTRPGRVEGLRGSTRRPTLGVLVGVDVSGSTAALQPVLQGVTAWVRRQPDVAATWAVWADRAAVVTSPASEAEVGWGTQVQSLWRLARRLRPDVVVCLSDGEVTDWLPGPGLPTVVVAPVAPPAGLGADHVPLPEVDR